MQGKLKLMVALITVSVMATGCATKKYVRGQVETLDGQTSERITGVESLVEENQEKLAMHEDELNRLDEATGELSKTAKDALDRAIAAGKLAEGKFLYETVLTDDSVRFGFNRAELSDEARAALDGFGSELIDRNEGVFIEIQGHTDSTGPDAYNYSLGEQRAESVLRYLNAEHGLPLHRMSAISYGETEPLEENTTLEARAHNRRVALVVLK